MIENLTFHHVGVAVPNLEQACTFYAEAFGWQVVSGPFEDPIQKVKVCFVGSAPLGSAPIELICPLDTTSPVHSYLAKGIGAYHICFEVGQIAEALEELWQKGCVVMAQPVPATAFAGRRIAWCFTPARQLIELLERQPAEPLKS